MPEAAETYAGWAKCKGYKEGEAFPLPYLLYMCGYVLILIIDRWLAADYHLSPDDEVDEVKISAPAKTQFISLTRKNPDSDDNSSIVLGDESSIDPKKKVNVGHPLEQKGNTVQVGDNEKDTTPKPKKDSKFKMKKIETVGDGETKRLLRVHAVSKASGVILALALGVHSFFEGIAFGLTTEVPNAA